MGIVASPRRAAGRPSQICLEDIERVGAQIGLRDLTVQAVAAELGVTPAALYRHVDGKFGLETVVGERILTGLQIADDPGHDVAEYLTSAAVQFRQFLLDHPGLATYVQILFPRGPVGEGLMAGQVASLMQRGCRPDAAVMACTTVALIVISVAAAEETRRDHAEQIAGMQQRREQALQAYVEQGLTETQMDADSYFTYVISSCLHGILESTGIGPGQKD